MSNHSRSIIHLPLNIHSPSPPDGILRVHLLLLFLSAATPYATAQSTTSSSEYQYESDDSINPSMATIMVVIVCAFFVMGIFTLYIRKCADSAIGNSRTFRVANGRSPQLQRGLDPSVIGSFPVFVYSEVKDIKIGKGALECAVCLSEFEGDENLRLLPKCDHVFHPECIDTWLASHTTCPVCRNDLTLISSEFGGDIEQQGESNESTDEQNPRSELSEIQDQVSISVDDDRGRDAQVVEITKRSETQKQSRRGTKKFPRSHSTGHSVLVLPGENRERYTLRLPEEFRKEMMTRRLKRTRSCVIVLPREESSRRGYRSGGEGSSRGRRVAWLSERLGRSDRWVFTMTPPFFARSTGSVRSPKVYSDGVEKSSAKTPVDCHSGNCDGVEKSSSPLPV